MAPLVQIVTTADGTKHIAATAVLADAPAVATRIKAIDSAIARLVAQRADVDTARLVEQFRAGLARQIEALESLKAELAALVVQL